MRRFFVLLLLVGLVGCLFLPFVRAETTQFGKTNIGATAVSYGTNILYGQSFSTSAWVADAYVVENGSAYITQGTGVASKMVILTWDRQIVAVSNIVVHSTGSHFDNFTFNSPILYKANINYTLCLINNANGLAVGSDLGGNAYQVLDYSNSFDNPSVPESTDLYSNAHQYNIFLTITAGDSPSPSPTATPSPSGHFIRLSPSPTVVPSVSPIVSGGGSGASNDNLLMIFLVVGVVVCGGFGLFALFDSKFEGGKPVAVLLVVVGLVVFVVLLFGIGVL